MGRAAAARQRVAVRGGVMGGGDVHGRQRAAGDACRVPGARLGAWGWVGVGVEKNTRGRDGPHRISLRGSDNSFSDRGKTPEL